MRQEWVGKRKTVRQSCFIRAEIRFGDERPNLGCTITDISSGGARLEGDLESVPESFELVIPARNEARLARVVHREPHVLGLRFILSREDPDLLPELIRRIATLEQASERTSPAQAEALEERVRQLEAELAMVRAAAAAAAQPSPPDRLSEVESLRDSLTTLAERLERTAAAPAPEPVHDPRVAPLAEELAQVRRCLADLETAVATLPRPDPTVAPAAIPDELAQEVSSLRQSVQSLILLVSQLVARSRPAA